MESIVHHADCMEIMAQYPDKHFDLAVVDPPYGIGESNSNFESRGVSSPKWKQAKPKIYISKEWDNSAPEKKYFSELLRISKKVIIWGANHFIENIPNANSSCWVVWDKDTSGDFADCELAWTNFETAVRKIKLVWSGFRKCENVNRIHPTQKPIKLYDWIYRNYLPEGGKVIDTHLGSGSNRIAADKAGNINFVGCELDKDYFDAQEKRWSNYKAQLTIQF
jgi:site-specific DNA-methyltransferase (adenine-specific)